MERKIIHLNVADFAVAVERVMDHRLKTRPVIIAPEGGSRASVYDMSDEAYREGVRKGMPISRARRLVRTAVILPPRPELYERATLAFVKKALPYSPLVEQADGDGHLFVDVTGTGRLFGAPQDVAVRIRRSVMDDIRLNPIWSVASNKLVAKVATRLVKPYGEYTVNTGFEENFLKPLPIHIIPGIYRNEIARLRELNLTIVGDASRLTLLQLEVLLGDRARLIYEKVRGMDNSPVLPAGRKPPTAKAAHVFGDDTNDLNLVEAVLFGCAERVGEELRRRSLGAKRIGTFIDYSDGVRTFRRVLSAKPASANADIFGLAVKALSRAWTRRLRIRHLQLLCDRLVPTVRQLNLFEQSDTQDERRKNLDRTFDSIRSRFGQSAVKLGKTLVVRN